MHSPRLFVSKALVYALLAVAVMVVVFPLVWMLGTAVKPNTQILDLRSSLWRRDLASRATTAPRAPSPRTPRGASGR